MIQDVKLTSGFDCALTTPSGKNYLSCGRLGRHRASNDTQVDNKVRMDPLSDTLD